MGASSELGAWDPFSTHAAMQWNEGDVWTTTISLSPGQHDFKLVVDNGEGRIDWEWGDNKLICLPEDGVAITMEVDCKWGYPEFNLVSNSSEVETIDMTTAAKEEEEEKETISTPPVADMTVAEVEGTITTHAVETKEEEEEEGKKQGEEAPAVVSLITAAEMEEMPEVIEEGKAAVVALTLPIIEETKTPEAATHVVPPPTVPTFESTSMLSVPRHVPTETSSSPPAAAPTPAAAASSQNIGIALTPFDSFSSDGRNTPTPPTSINPMAAALATSAVALAGLAFIQLGHMSPSSSPPPSSSLSLPYNKSNPIITASINKLLSTAKATPASIIFSSPSSPSSSTSPKISSLETVVPLRKTSEVNPNIKASDTITATSSLPSLVGYNMAGMYKDLVSLKEALYQLERS